MPKRLSHDEVAARLLVRGFKLISPYQRRRIKVLVECLTHHEAHSIDVGNTIAGKFHELPCCGREKRREALRGRPKSDREIELTIQRNRDRVWSDQSRHRIREWQAQKWATIAGAMQGASVGRTAGKVGLFYIARRADGELKFGSTTNLKWRVKDLNTKTGVRHAVILTALVPDAGAYEAMMMERHREHWIRGERFRDFLVPVVTA